MKEMKAVMGVAMLLLLVGAGCTTGEDPQVKDANPGADTTMSTETEVSTPVTTPEVSVDTEDTGDTSTFQVTAAPVGDKKLSVIWTVPESMATDKDITAYRILVGKTENPTSENKYYWYERGAVYRDKIVEGLNLGGQHVRVCAVKAGECAVYSNDVMVDVK